jgi:hypothetical protein
MHKLFKVVGDIWKYLSDGASGDLDQLMLPSWKDGDTKQIYLL